MSDDIINLESRIVFRDVSNLMAGGMSTAAALAHAAHEAAERQARMTTGFAQDDYIRSLEDRIAALEKVAEAAQKFAVDGDVFTVRWYENKDAIVSSLKSAGYLQEKES